MSEAASIALHSLSVIAKSKKMISVNYIAGVTGSSRNHLSKIMQVLSKFGYIKSVRGPKGGFIMGKNAGDITLLEIFEMIEGKLEVNKCTQENKKCFFKACIFGGLTEKFSEEFRNYLENTSVHDVIQ